MIGWGEKNREQFICILMKKIITLFLFVSLSSSILSGCSGQERTEGDTVNGFAFNTTYSISVYQGGSKELLNECIGKCSEYEKIFSRTDRDSELYQVNEVEALYEKYSDEGSIRKNRPKTNKTEFQIREDGSLACEVSELLYGILEKGLYYSRQSQGAFDITIAPVSSLWDFTGEHPSVPAKDELQRAVKRVSYKKLSLEDGRVVFHEPGMALDLGGIAKGYIADALKKYLTDGGVTSGLINLGGNILCIGKKPDGEAFRIGIQQPFADRNETVAAVQSDDMSVVSSGIYERYFQAQDGALYHHILNPKTGYSYDNDLMAVTILSAKSTDGDGLSTTCFSMGLDKGIAYVNSLDGVEALFITRDEKLHYSGGWNEFAVQ